MGLFDLFSGVFDETKMLTWNRTRYYHPTYLGKENTKEKWYVHDGGNNGKFWTERGVGNWDVNDGKTPLRPGLEFDPNEADDLKKKMLKHYGNSIPKHHHADCVRAFIKSVGHPPDDDVTIRFEFPCREAFDAFNALWMDTDDGEPPCVVTCLEESGRFVAPVLRPA